MLVHDGVDRVSLDDLFPTLPGVMTRTIRCFIVAFVLSLSGWNAHAQAKEPVDLLLALAADVSRSIDADKFKLQREGYAAAFSDPRVVNAIASGLHRRIAVCFIRQIEHDAEEVEPGGRLALFWNGFDAELLDASGLTVARAGGARCRLRKSWAILRAASTKIDGMARLARHRRLLRTRRERPCSRRAAEQRDELASLQLVESHS